MKKRLFFLLSLFLSIFTSCQESLDFQQVKEIRAIITDFEFEEETATRTSYTYNSGFNAVWSAGDILGIYPVGGDQVSFPITEGAGTNSAVFNGGSWALKGSYKYSAYYPFSTDFYTISETSIPVSYLGQIQKGNNSTSHFSQKDYMVAPPTQPDETGNVTLPFQHLCYFMKFELTMPHGGTYTKLELESDQTEFITEGTIDLSKEDVPLTPTSTSAKVTIDLENVTLTDDNLELDVNLMIVPQNFSGSTIKVRVYDREGVVYVASESNANVDLKPTSAFLRGRSTRIRRTMIASSNGNGAGGEIIDGGEDPEGGESETDTTPYVTFHSEGAQTLKMTKAVSTLQYSVDGGTWADLGTTEVSFGGTTGDLRLRGQNLSGTAYYEAAGDYYDSNSIVLTAQGNASPVSCTGDIRTLVNYESYETVDCSNAHFYGLFSGCTSLITAPALPAMSLADDCYAEMFKDCTSLTTAPALPAKILAGACYLAMFSGCTSLVTAPALPAETLANYCYVDMFKDCTSLTTAPELSAETLKKNCYNGMFSGCTSLVTAPALSAMSLADDCYAEMFKDCTSLTTAPALPATTLANSCYYAMFLGCTSLTTAPALPAKTLASNCYLAMFVNCSNLSTIKMLATDISAAGCLDIWTNDVANNGTFYKSIDATWNDEGVVPADWTVIYLDAQGNEVQPSIHNGHEYVDLGITVNGQKLLWATTNVGAETATSYGDYYAWGETSPYYTRINNGTDIFFSSTNPGYSYQNYKYAVKSGSTYDMTKYTLGNVGSYNKDDKSVLDPVDDAASKNWGGSWRTPTLDEIDLLKTQCCRQAVNKYKSDTYNGVAVSGFIFYKAKSEEDKGKYVDSSRNTYTMSDPHIFLPVGGYYEDKTLNYKDWGYYWTSSLCGTSSYYRAAYNVNFYLDETRSYYAYTSSYDRCYGYAVRPVCIISE